MGVMHVILHGSYIRLAFVTAVQCGVVSEGVRGPLWGAVGCVAAVLVVCCTRCSVFIAATCFTMRVFMRGYIVPSGRFAINFG